MTRPRQQWPALANLVISFGQDMFDDHEDEAAALASYLAATPAGDRRRALAELDEALATTASEQERSDLLDQLGFCYLVEPDYAGIDAFIAWLRAELAASLGDDG